MTISTYEAARICAAVAHHQARFDGIDLARVPGDHPHIQFAVENMKAILGADAYSDHALGVLVWGQVSLLAMRLD